MNNFSRNIIFLRKQKGLTQEEMSNEIGFKKSRIGAWEEGRSQPSIEDLIRISEYFNTPIDYLIKYNYHDTNLHRFLGCATP